MTKSIRPNFSIVFATASWSCLGFLTSACAARHWLPVAAESSLALAWRRSNLTNKHQHEYCSRLRRDDSGLLPPNDGRIRTMPHLSRHTAVLVSDTASADRIQDSRTTASVIALHIPEPPPVQNKTFPLKRSFLKTAVESVGAGST